MDEGARLILDITLVVGQVFIGGFIGFAWGDAIGFSRGRRQGYWEAKAGKKVPR